jgi:hypothetical protein
MATQADKQSISGKFNFERFLTLFKSEDSHQNQNKNLSPKEQALEKQAQVFLDSDMIDLFVKMQTNGYAPTVAQTELFEKKLVSKINYNYSREVLWLEELVNLGYELSPTIYTTLMMNDDFQNNWEYFCDRRAFINPYGSYARYTPEQRLKETLPELEDSKQPNLIAQMIELSKKPEYYQPAFDTWIERFRNIRAYCEPCVKRYNDDNHALINQSFKGIAGALHMRAILLAHLDMGQYIELSNELVQSASKDIFPNVSKNVSDKVGRNMQTINSSWPANILPFYKMMQEEFKVLYANDIDGILNETKSVFIENYLAQRAAKESLNLAKDYSISQLPQAEQDLLNQIKEQYARLVPHYKSMNEEDKHNLNHLVVDKLPVIINRYLSMNEEYRQTMVNSQGKNAQELLHESLSNIEAHLQKINLNINELNLKELSVSARYTEQKNRF